MVLCLGSPGKLIKAPVYKLRLHQATSHSSLNFASLSLSLLSPACLYLLYISRCLCHILPCKYLSLLRFWTCLPCDQSALMGSRKLMTVCLMCCYFQCRSFTLSRSLNSEAEVRSNALVCFILFSFLFSSKYFNTFSNFLCSFFFDQWLSRNIF